MTSGAETTADATSALDALDWGAARARADALLARTTRFRVAGGSPGVELAALDFGGDGPLVVMHHANGFCGAVLAPVAAGLRDRFRVVALDARGHGDSTSVPPAPLGELPDPYDWDLLGRDARHAIEGVLAHTGHDRVHLGIGHSFGGALLLRAAAALGDAVAGLLLCDPVILPPMSPEARASRRAANPLSAASRRRRDRWPDFATAWEHCRARPFFRTFTPEALALYVGEALRETDGGEVALKCDREVEAAVFDRGPASGWSVDVSGVRGRVVFVHARRGNFSADYYREVARPMADARVLSEDLDHLFPLEVPERVVALVDERF